MKINKIPSLPQGTYGMIRFIICETTNKVIESFMISDHKIWIKRRMEVHYVLAKTSPYPTIL